MDIIQPHPGNFILLDKNADPTNWEWKDEYRALWTLAMEPWPTFRNKWYGNTASLVESQSLSLEPLDDQIDPFLTTSLFIRPSYLTMFESVCSTAMLMCSERKERRGVIITGQPGTGKSFFNYYLLVRLLQLRQVILYSPNGKDLYLFHHDGVYTPTGNNFAWLTAGFSLKKSLPHPISPKSLPRDFIWSLFDICEPKEPVRELLDPPCFPIQTTSPDPIRYKTWQKEYVPFITGMPLWSRDELAQGLRCQDACQSLLDALSVYVRPGPNDVDPLTKYPGTCALLEDRFGGDDVSHPSPDEALDYILDTAIDHFGYSAGDVFAAVFDFDCMTTLHENAFPPRYSDLEGTRSRSGNPTYTLSDYLFALSPIYSEQPLVGVRWEVDFKSDWIAKNVIWKLDPFDGESEETIYQKIDYLNSLSLPKARALARRSLESSVHHYITNATGDSWSLGSTHSNDVDPPHFTLVTDSPVAGCVRFPQVRRKIVKLQSLDSLSSYLENDCYYIPADPSFPMVDAFTVDFDRAEKSAVLWVIQVTTSRTHGGSSLGYQKVRQIVAILKNELQVRGNPSLKTSKVFNGQAALTPFVEVRYLLVVPKDECQSTSLQWVFPKGWSQNRDKHDHCGDVYYLEVPFTI